MTVAARTFGYAAYLSVFEFFSRYRPLEWVIAWVPRIVLQLAFFYWLAEFLGGSDLRAYLLIGSAAQTAVHVLLVFATQAIGRELWGGTMILLLATPARLLVVLTGRGLADMANGLVTAAIGLAVTFAALGLATEVHLVVGAAAILLVISASAYGLALFIGSVMLRFPQLQNAVSNLVGQSMLVLCGVMVPVSFLAPPLQVVAAILPLTHGLEGLRALLAGAGPERVIPPLAREVTVGAAYLVLANLSFAHFLYRARARGTLDFH